MAKQRFNRLNRPKKPLREVIKKWSKKLPFLLLILAIAAFGYSLDRSHLFDPVIGLTIDGKPNRGDTHYKQLIAPLLDNKYLIDLAELKTSLEVEPWIADAHVKRIFWNRIDINISTHVIAMRWHDKGYISNKGIVFKPKKLLTSQAPLAIVEVDKARDFFQDFQEYQAILTPLVITKFERNQIDQLTIKPNVGIILGNQNQNHRLKNFVRAYNKLERKSRKIRKRGIFDMRYPKGFALSYQQQ